MSAAADRLLAQADELVANALAFKAEVRAWVGEETCGGMIAEGVCERPFGHEPPCGLEVGGRSCPAPADHAQPCREVD